MKTIAGLSLMLLTIEGWSQNPATVIDLPSRQIVMGCGVRCTTLTATIPNIRQTEDYTVKQIPYQPFSYATATGNELTPIYADDRFSDSILLPFRFCFFGQTYGRAVVGSNSVISFDSTNANKANSWPLTTSGGSGAARPIPYAGGIQNNNNSTYYPRASIMGPYHDVSPLSANGGARKIEWRIEGTAPARRFIASYKDVPMYICRTTSATHQMVIYESTGIIEFYIQDKPVCRPANKGLAILGIQNFDRNKAVAAPGKNATVWGEMNMKEAYRFIPSSGASMFKKAELLVNGSVVATGDTTSGSGGELNLRFPDICPSGDSTMYLMRVTYVSCNAPGEEIVFEDSVSIKKLTPSMALHVENATCSLGGVITGTASGGTGTILYSMDGSAFQTNPSFNNLTAGDHIFSIKDAAGCSVATSVNVPFQNDLYMAAMSDTVVCPGTNFVGKIQSNATSYNWAPTIGLSDAAVSNPLISSSTNITYVITATSGPCAASDTLNIRIREMPRADAGQDIVVIAGDQVQLSASATPGIYSWTPAAQADDPHKLNPRIKTSVTTTYRLDVTSNDGCTASDEVTVTVVPYCVKPMEAFSPNGDGINDLWLITTGSCLQKASAQVFNRYGSKVYEAADYRNNWNGTYYGKPLPDGTYYYVLSFKLINGKTVYLRGNVSILR
jgi:gliding motility-associated-like protein